MWWGETILMSAFWQISMYTTSLKALLGVCNFLLKRHLNLECTGGLLVLTLWYTPYLGSFLVPGGILKDSGMQVRPRLVDIGIKVRGIHAMGVVLQFSASRCYVNTYIV